MRLRTGAFKLCLSRGALAQLVRAPPCHGGGCGFEPRRLRIYFPSLRGELRKIVNAQPLLDPRHSIHDLFESVLAEQFVFLLLEVFA